MQWHFQSQFGVGIDALEIDVQNLGFVRVVLDIAQQYFLRCATQVHFQNRAVEGFFFQGVPQFVVIDFDQGRGSCATVNDTRRAARIAQTAARTRTLLIAFKSVELHGITPQKSKAPRPAHFVFKKPVPTPCRCRQLKLSRHA